MKAGIVIFPGIDRERDMAIALERSGATPRMIWHEETDLAGLDLIVIPGGFSFGDYLRCGATDCAGEIKDSFPGGAACFSEADVDISDTFGIHG